MKIVAINNSFNIKKKENSYKTSFKHENKNDVLEIKASNDGKFSKKEAGKNFIKGMILPLRSVVEHPLISIGTVAITGVACSLIPVLTPVMSIGFGALSIFQLGSGIFNSINEYKKGNYDNSEKAFEKIGQGTIGTATSLLSVKRNTRIVEEAYVMKSLERTKLSYRECSKIKDNVDNRGYIESLKIIFSMFKTKKGRESFVNQFKPFMIKERAKDFLSSLNPANKKTDIIKTYDKRMYKRTAEGKRRAKLTEADIEKEVTLKFNKIFDDLGIEQEYRPKLIIKNMDNALGGAYSASDHFLLYNTNAYRNGLGDIDEVLMHEATHCKRALLRSGLSKSELENTVKSILRSKILNGDVEEIPFADGNFAPRLVKPPLMSKKMRFDFLKFAEQDLFVENKALNQRLLDYQHQFSLAMTKSGYANPVKLASAETDVLPILDKLKVILSKYPDFIAQYDSYDEALNVLLKYAISQNSRYSSFVDAKVGKGIKYPVPTSQIEVAKQSLKEYIPTVESNRVVSKCYGKFVDKQAYNQYIFSDEEVLAQRVASEFVAKTLTAELASGKKVGVLSPEREMYLNNQIQKALLTSEHRAKGLEYYKNYTRLLNNPNNHTLKILVQQQQKELDLLMQKINALRPQYKEKVVSYLDKMTTVNPINLILMLLSQKESKKEE